MTMQNCKIKTKHSFGTFTINSPRVLGQVAQTKISTIMLFISK